MFLVVWPNREVFLPQPLFTAISNTNINISDEQACFMLGYSDRG